MLLAFHVIRRYYRASSVSDDPRVCPAYCGVPGAVRCTGARGVAMCAGLLSGVYCTACPERHYLSAERGACVQCAGLAPSTVAMCAALGTIALLLLLLLLCSARLARLGGRLSVWRRLGMLSEAAGLAAKTKQLVSFYQARPTS